jgi:hypothetical protein
MENLLHEFNPEKFFHSKTELLDRADFNDYENRLHEKLISLAENPENHKFLLLLIK